MKRVEVNEMKISDKLKRLMSSKQITTEELARDTSINSSELEEILNDNTISNKNKVILSDYFGIEDTYFNDEKPVTKKDILYFIILVLSGLLILSCLLWAGLRPYNIGPYYLTSAWYIPFYWIDTDIFIFQMFNILGIVGIVYSLLKLNGVKIRKKMKKNVK